MFGVSPANINGISRYVPSVMWRFELTVCRMASIGLSNKMKARRQMT